MAKWTTSLINGYIGRKDTAFFYNVLRLVFQDFNGAAFNPQILTFNGLILKYCIKAELVSTLGISDLCFYAPDRTKYSLLKDNHLKWLNRSFEYLNIIANIYCEL